MVVRLGLDAVGGLTVNYRDYSLLDPMNFPSTIDLLRTTSTADVMGGGGAKFALGVRVDELEVPLPLVPLVLLPTAWVSARRRHMTSICSLGCAIP